MCIPACTWVGDVSKHAPGQGCVYHVVPGLGVWVYVCPGVGVQTVGVDRGVWARGCGQRCVDRGCTARGECVQGVWTRRCTPMPHPREGTLK